MADTDRAPDPEARYAKGQREEGECRKCGQPIWIVYQGPHANHLVEPRAVEAWLDSLLGGLPEEAVEAGAVEIAHAEVPEHYPATPEEMAVHYVDSAALPIRAFLRSLRTGLEGEG
jgi:hypothetical protein